MDLNLLWKAFLMNRLHNKIDRLLTLLDQEHAANPQPNRKHSSSNLFSEVENAKNSWDKDYLQ